MHLEFFLSFRVFYRWECHSSALPYHLAIHDVIILARGHVCHQYRDQMRGYGVGYSYHTTEYLHSGLILLLCLQSTLSLLSWVIVMELIHCELGVDVFHLALKCA